MRRLLRSLEKKLVVERTELAVVPRVNDLLSRWEDAPSHDRPAPDPLDFVASLIRSGFCLTAGPKAFAYLDECRRGNSLPDRRRLLQVLMPGLALSPCPDPLEEELETHSPHCPVRLPTPPDTPRATKPAGPGAWSRGERQVGHDPRTGVRVATHPQPHTSVRRHHSHREIPSRRSGAWTPVLMLRYSPDFQLVRN